MTLLIVPRPAPAEAGVSPTLYPPRPYPIAAHQSEVGSGTESDPSASHYSTSGNAYGPSTAADPQAVFVANPKSLSPGQQSEPLLPASLLYRPPQSRGAPLHATCVYCR